MSNKRRFWRNVALIGVAHAAAVIGLVRWNAAAMQPNPQNIVWMNGDLAEGTYALSEKRTPAERKSSLRETTEVAPTPPEVNSSDEKPLLVTSAKSEIELPAPTVTPQPTVKPNPTPVVKVPPKPTPHPPRKPRPKPTPKPKPTPTAKPKRPKTVLAKVFPRPSPKAKPSASPENDNESKDEETSPEAGREDSPAPSTEPRSDKTATALSKSAGEGSAGAGQGHGMAKTSELAAYGRMLHDRFYSEWIQPTTTVASATKISTVVHIRIEKDGRVSRFEVVKPSGNVMVDESVAAVGKQVTQVDPLPAALRRGGHYDVKINFELNSD